MDALREATEKLKQKRKKKSKKDKMSHHVRGVKWMLTDEDSKEIQLISLSYTVGQGSGSDIHIKDDTIDQTHAFINFSEDLCCFQVTDLSSHTGTYVNDSRIPPQHPITLQSQDTLRFGNSSRRFTVDSNMSERTRQRDREHVEVSATMEHHHHHQHLIDSRNEVTTATSHHSHHMHSAHRVLGDGSPVYKTNVQGLSVLSKVSSTSGASRSPTTPRRSRHRNTSQSENQSGKSGENGPDKQEVKAVWATRQETSHIMAECPGCIAEQEIRHTCGGQEDSTLPPHTSVAHTHPVNHPSPLQPQHLPLPQQTWEEAPPHYHHPPYPTVDYRTYSNPPTQRAAEDYLYSPTSPGFNPAHHFPSERRSHEASESQLKRSKSAQFQYEAQGFVPYNSISRDPYHYQYPSSQYPGHSYHHPPPPHPLHGYYRPQTTRPPPPMYTHYPSKAMYHGCKTCSSFMAEYGQVPREHLHYHDIMAQKQEISQEDSSFPPPLPKQPPPVGVERRDNTVQDTSPSDQGYGSQTEKVESMESSISVSTSSKLEDSVNDHVMSTSQVSCDTEVSDISGVNYMSTLSAKVTCNDMAEAVDKVKGFENDDTTGSAFLNSEDVDIIPERDTNHTSGRVSRSPEVESQTILRTGVTTDHSNPVSLDLSLSQSAPLEVSSILRSAKPTHTPPERDTGPHEPNDSILLDKQPVVADHTDVVCSMQGEKKEQVEEVSRSIMEESSSVSLENGANKSPNPVAPLVKSVSIDVAEMLHDRETVSHRKPRREETFVKSEKKTCASHEFSATSPETAEPGNSSDILANEIESSSKNICDNVEVSEPVTSTPTQTFEPDIPISNKAPESYAIDAKTSDPPVPAKRGSNMAFTVDLGNDTPTRPSNTMTATAFTVDMGMEEVTPSNKKLTHSDSLSNFLPQKLRKSFKDRASKVKSEKEEKQANEGTGNESESHHSPLTKRRGMKGTKSSRTPRTGYHSDGTHSNMSSDNEEYSIHSDRTSAARKSLPPGPTQTSQRPRHRPKPENSHTRTTRVLEGMSVEKKLEQRMLRSKSAGFSKAGSIDDYLNSMEQCDDRENNAKVAVQKTEVNPPPEYVLYKEAKHYDSIIQSKSSTNRRRGGGEDSGGKKPRVNTSSRSLNVPRPAEDEDNLSETGTYTIDNDKDVQSARQSIDTLFNVPDRLESLRMRTSGYLPPRQQPKGHQPSHVDHEDNDSGGHVTGHVMADGDINGNFEGSEGERGFKPHVYVGDSMDAEVGNTLKSSREQTSEQEKSSFYVTAIAPNSAMIKYHNTDSHTELTKSPDLHLVQSIVSSTSPHSQGGRRTRRKLPTPPVKAQSDPASPRTPRTTNAEVDVDSPGRHRGSVTYSNDEGASSFTVSFDAPQKNDTLTPRDEESMVSSLFSQGLDSRSSDARGQGALDSVHNVRSLATEVLLKDTEHVHEQQVEKQKYMRKDSLDEEEYESGRYSPVTKEELCLDLDRDSDSEASSTNAVVDESLPQYGSKSDALQKSHKLHKSRESYKGKPFSIKDRALGLKGKTSKRLSSSSADFDHFGGTDDSENESSSFASTGTDYSNLAQNSPKFQRQGSTGRGNIANTRTNRTFALRRGVADGSDSESARTETARSARSVKSTPRTRSRPSSAKESSRTDASLGTKVAQKNKDNAKTSSRDTKDSSLTRKDGGRFSLRGNKSAALSSVSKVSESKAKKKPDLSTPRSGRLSTGSLSASSSTPKSSQTASKSVKKADEYQAWQRRHKYDPRKAVADAKAKEKRARSVGNTPEFADSRPRGETIDSVSSEEMHMDEITKLSSAVANDLNLMTNQAKRESETYTEEFTEVRSSAFKSVTSSVTNGSAFKSPVKNASSPLYSPVPIKGLASTQYDPVLVNSIQQMSSQLKSQVHRIMDRLSEERGADTVPVEDLMSQSVEDASPELNSTLSNLRNTELLLRVLERELFSESEEVSLQECNRIRDEAGFRPIPQPQHSREPGKSKKPAPSSRKSGHMTRKSHHTQESRVTYPSTDYY